MQEQTRAGTKPRRPRQPIADQHSAFCTIDDWCRLSGMRRSSTYSLIRDGHLRAVKNGKALLIDVPHGLAYMNSLPPAKIRGGRKAAA